MTVTTASQLRFGVLHHIVLPHLYFLARFHIMHCFLLFPQIDMHARYPCDFFFKKNLAM